MFSIQTDTRITKDLVYCLYCFSDVNSMIPLHFEHKIQLTPVLVGIKQCPMCKRVYILTDDFLALDEMKNNELDK